MDSIYEGLRVCELADRRNQFAGKLLADAGATVVQIEPPGGCAARLSGPFAGDIPDPVMCLDYWYYNAGKRSVAVDLNTPDGAPLAVRLLEAADVVIESHRAPFLRSLGLDYVTLAARTRDRIVQASITDFGQDGPWSDHLANAHAHLALGGQMASSGYSGPDVTPIGGQVNHAYHIAGVLAVQAITVALIERLASGMGQYIDCAIHDCCSICTENAVPAWVHSGEILYRHTGQHAAAQRQGQATLPCSDGRWVNTITTELTDFHWSNLIEWMRDEGVAEDLDDARYFEPAFRARQWRRGNEIREGFKRLLARLPAEEVMRKAQQFRLAWAVVRAPEENYDDDHWRARGFFRKVQQGDRTVRFPSRAFLSGEAPMGPRGPAPNVGEHTAEVLGEWLDLGGDQLADLRATGVVA
jgi:crotonobetainyl-CoA:carnitine CoA-transferase CaiB-like acyl-CoA transferase